VTAMRWSLEHGMMVRRFGAGPEVVWLHGLGEWSLSFDPIAAHPALAGFSHVLPDLPGYGRSPWPADVDDVEDLARLADRLAAWLGGRTPALIGHSMGGVLAGLVAERAPVRAVVDCEGNLSLGDCVFSAKAVAYSLDDFVAHGFAAIRAQTFEAARTEPALRSYVAALATASPHTFHQHARDLVALSQLETRAARLAQLAAPVLYIAGAPDGICPRSHDLLAAHGLRRLSLSPAAHWAFVDQPDAFATAVASFLHAP
jgi:pimeloyl-ACP methyl ester carboxylesterase